MRGRLAVMDYAEAKAAEEARRQAEMQEEEARRRNAVYMRQPAGGISQQAGRVNAPNPYAGYSTTHETYEGERTLSVRPPAMSTVLPLPNSRSRPTPKSAVTIPVPAALAKSTKTAVAGIYDPMTTIKAK